MKTNIGKLHNLFLNEEKYPGRKEGHTTLFAWQLIGLAELNCYSWNKIHQPVWIPFNKPTGYVLETIDMIGKICYENAIDFAKNSSHQIVIYNTLFDFYRIDDIPFNKPIPAPIGYLSSYYFSSREDNDCMWREWEMTEENKKRVINDVFNEINICGSHLRLVTW